MSLKYLAIDSDVNFAESEAMAWRRELGIDMDRVDDMHEGMKKLKSGNYLYIGINSDVVEFKSLLNTMQYMATPIFIATSERNYLSFEEDCEEAVALRELLDKKLWTLPDRITDKAGYEYSINRSLAIDWPEYWEARQKRLDAQTGRAEAVDKMFKPKLTDRLDTGKAKAAEHNTAADKSTLKPRHTEVGD